MRGGGMRDEREEERRKKEGREGGRVELTEEGREYKG
jgi:hypothetical protein